MSLINVTVKYEQREYKFQILETESIQTLISRLCDKNESLSETNTSLKFGGFLVSPLKTLKELGVKNGNILEQVKKDLSQIAGLVVSYEPDMISLDSTIESRAKMPCGHVISRESMTEFLRNLIRQRVYIIECPGTNSEAKVCRRVWDFALCAKIGVLSKEEREEFENGFAKILILELLKAKSCPQCANLIMKPENFNSERVACIKCKNDFCWICMRTWIGGGGNKCGNFGGGSTEEQLKILANCKTKDIGAKIKGVPDTRACPNCKTMIMHGSACKHMECYKCHKKFCFMCLSMQQDDKWICGGAYDPCAKMAPKQTEL